MWRSVREDSSLQSCFSPIWNTLINRLYFVMRVKGWAPGPLQWLANHPKSGRAYGQRSGSWWLCALRLMTDWIKELEKELNELNDDIGDSTHWRVACWYRKVGLLLVGRQQGDVWGLCCPLHFIFCLLLHVAAWKTIAYKFTTTSAIWGVMVHNTGHLLATL